MQSEGHILGEPLHAFGEAVRNAIGRLGPTVYLMVGCVSVLFTYSVPAFHP